MVVFEVKGAKQAEERFTDEFVRDNQSMIEEMKKRAIVIDAEALSYLQTHPEHLK